MNVRTTGALLLALAALANSPSLAHGYRESGKSVAVAGDTITVTPASDWNQLSGKAGKPGKKAEVWTLDGEQLNEVTFYGGIAPGEPLIREHDKKGKPLPKFTRETLLVEVPELVETTYRTDRQLGSFTVTASKPVGFLGAEGILFTYAYVDDDNLPRRGEARAALIKGLLFMVTFDAPRLHYFEKAAPSFRSLADSAKVR